MRIDTKWKIGVLLVLFSIAFIVLITASWCEKEDLWGAFAIFGAALVILAGGLACSRAYHGSLNENIDLNKELDEKNISLTSANSAIMSYIEDKITDDIQRRNELYAESERKSFFPMRIDREGDSNKIVISAQKRKGDLNSRYTPLFFIILDIEKSTNISLEEIAGDRTPPCNPPYPLTCIDDFIACFRVKIKEFKLPLY